MQLLIPVLAACALGVLLIAYVLRVRTLSDMGRQLEYILREDTNALIRIPPSGRTLRRICSKLNMCLSEMRAKELRLYRGDLELKEALRAWSHDLRTPLTAVSGYVELLSEEDLSSEARRYLDVIERRLEVLSEITEELFAFALLYAEGGAEGCEAFDLVPLVEETAGSFYDAFSKKGLDADISLPNHSVVILAEKMAVQRILYNLFSNALKYGSMPIKIQLSQSGLLTVENGAPQMEPLEAAELLGQTSVRHFTKRSGTGLLVVRRLMEKMHGSFDGILENGILKIGLTFPRPE